MHNVQCTMCAVCKKSSMSSIALPLLVFAYIITRARCFDTTIENDRLRRLMRIVGGRPVTQGTQRYPWFARPFIQGKSPKNLGISSQHHLNPVGCGGILVSPEYGKYSSSVSPVCSVFFSSLMFWDCSIL